jgi:hypothetical protein
MIGMASARVCFRLSGNAVRNRQTLIPASHAFQTSSLLHRSPTYPGHIPLNAFENAFLTVGSALMAFMDPRRGGRHFNNGLECFHYVDTP